jgi:hypothetical protein
MENTATTVKPGSGLVEVLWSGEIDWAVGTAGFSYKPEGKRLETLWFVRCDNDVQAVIVDATEQD